MNKCGDSVRVAYPLFQTEGGGSIPTSPLQLNIIEISTEKAVQLNKLWHSRLPMIKNPYGDHISFGALYDGIYYASAIWTKPIARLFNGKNYLELRRFAISSDSPRNTASRMISIMTKLIRKSKPHIVKLISYQDTDVHGGTIYKASGWHEGIKSAGGGSCINSKQTWKNNVRKREDSQSTGYKIRWEYDL